MGFEKNGRITSWYFAPVSWTPKAEESRHSHSLSTALSSEEREIGR